MNKSVACILVLASVLLFVSGCDALPLAALNRATDTPTRTPRPTFTPKSSPTQISTPTETAAATDTIAAVDTDTPEVVVEASETPKPVVRATRPPAPPPAPTQPPAPQLPVQPDPNLSPTHTAAYPCFQEGSFYEVILYVKKYGQPGKRTFAPGLTFAAFAPGATTPLKDYGGKPMVSATDNGGMSGYAYGSNCEHSGTILDPDRFNGKLDVGDAVRAGTTSMVIRFIRSATDFTPQSVDTTISFSQTGRWWLYFGAQ